jgi:putative ribosome biogenesis GTPase RsgA
MNDVEYIRNNFFFIGREKEIARFRTSLNQLNDSTILYVHGESGIGKSSLLEKFEQICKNEEIPVAIINMQSK